MNADYYEDRRFCSRCRSYVLYLYSPSGSYCVECGGPVHLFSDDDEKSFRASLRGLQQDFELGPGDDREAG